MPWRTQELIIETAAAAVILGFVIGWMSHAWL